MRFQSGLLALALTTTLLGGCEHSDGGARPDGRATLPPVPADLRACFTKAFPEIPATAFDDVRAARIIGRAKLLDRAKSECADRALTWMESVARDYGR